MQTDDAMTAGAGRTLVGDFVGTLERALWPRVWALLAGELGPDPANRNFCTNCDFRALCRFTATIDDDESAETEGES
ncbi:MAG: hypothetical protein H7Z43_09630 [Clostridia bacterium]|nr:hypothetical protein [Deltaproteobacteria bacterium]